MNSKPTVSRFYSLDDLRGLAALAVVFSHWVHFFVVGTTPPENLAGKLPLNEWFNPIYANGYRAVDFFFSLSGFIFFWLYARPIEKRGITFQKFCFLRFSRLYPLHFATLLVVALGQIFFLHTQGAWWIYGNNDLPHFTEQIFFASNWWAGDASFNGPVWSVSVEILLYLFFFVACRLGWTKPWQLLALAAAGYAAKEHWVVGKGILGFFLGGIVCWLFLKLNRTEGSKKPGSIFGLLAIVLWVLVPLNDHWQWLDQFAKRIGEWSQHASATKVLVHYAEKITSDLYAVVLFPATILAMALNEHRFGAIWKRLSFLGDISYSSYLLHFPLQMLCVFVVGWLGWSRAIFSRPASLLVFFTVLILVSLACHNYFERPVQNWLRTKNPWRQK